MDRRNFVKGGILGSLASFILPGLSLSRGKDGVAIEPEVTEEVVTEALEESIGSTISNNTATVTFQSSGFTGELTNVEWSGQTYTSVDVSHPGDGGRTFVPAGMSDPGELSLEVLYDPEFPTPTLGPTETISLTFPMDHASGTVANWEGQGSVTGFSFMEPIEDRVVANIDFRFVKDPVIKAGGFESS